MAFAHTQDPTIIKLLSDASTVREGFELMVRCYSRPLYWKIRSIVLVHEDADDVLQNTWIKVWRNLDTFEGKSRLSTWIYRIAVNEALDLLRRQKVRPTQQGEEVQTIADKLMDDPLFDGEKTEALLREAIATLPNVQRMVFNMKYYDNMKYNEMSEILGTSEGALKASYHIAVKKVSDYVLNKSTD